MNYTAMQFWLNLFIFASNVTVAIYIWRSNKEKVTTAKFDTLTKRIGESEKAMTSKISEMESKLERRKECPHHPSFEARLDAMNGSLNKVDGRLEGIGRAVDLMNQFLINGGK